MAVPLPGGTAAPASLWGPAADVRRARQLLVAGMMGAHVAAFLCVGGFALGAGRAAAASAAIAAAIVIVFYGVGQGVQVILARSHPAQVLAGSLLSYAARVGLLAALLNLALANTGRLRELNGAALLTTTIATVVGWVGAEARRFHTMPHPVFDTEYHAPAVESAQ